jgi:hypothetical protein
MTYHIILDHCEKIPCEDYADMVKLAWAYREQGRNVVEVKSWN